MHNNNNMIRVGEPTPSSYDGSRFGAGARIVDFTRAYWIHVHHYTHRITAPRSSRFGRALRYCLVCGVGVGVGGGVRLCCALIKLFNCCVDRLGSAPAPCTIAEAIASAAIAMPLPWVSRAMRA